GRDRLRAARMEGGRAEEDSDCRLSHKEHAAARREQGRTVQARAQERPEARRRLRQGARAFRGGLEAPSRGEGLRIGGVSSKESCRKVRGEIFQGEQGG